MKNHIILGLDIGGANTKAALVEFKEGEIVRTYSNIEYFPFWEKTLNDIPEMLNRFVLKLITKNGFKLEDVENIAVSITAELSDAFQTKREGILQILTDLESIFPRNKLFFISNLNKFLNFEVAKQNYLTIAAANWVSTALFLGQFIPQCILIDAGSTTVDIIPILNSIPVTIGKDDISRMMNHELVYTGGLRATIPSITHFIPFRGAMVRISFEKFALISDVHRILDNISEDEYINDTADNRSTSKKDCYARLARIICMDEETISRDELDKIAQYIYSKQLEIISSEIKYFMDELTERIPEFKKDLQFVITGSSANYIIRRALDMLYFKNIELYEEITNIPNNISSSAFAVAGAFYISLNKSGV